MILLGEKADIFLKGQSSPDLRLDTKPATDGAIQEGDEDAFPAKRLAKHGSKGA